MYSYSSNSFPGIGAFAGVNVVTGNEGFHYEPEKNYMGNEIMKTEIKPLNFAIQAPMFIHRS